MPLILSASTAVRRIASASEAPLAANLAVCNFTSKGGQQHSADPGLELLPDGRGVSHEYDYMLVRIVDDIQLLVFQRQCSQLGVPEGHDRGAIANDQVPVPPAPRVGRAD